MLTKANENFEKFSVLLEYVTMWEASECRASQCRAPKGNMTITQFYQAKATLSNRQLAATATLTSITSKHQKVQH